MDCSCSVSLLGSAFWRPHRRDMGLGDRWSLQSKPCRKPCRVSVCIHDRWRSVPLGCRYFSKSLKRATDADVAAHEYTCADVEHRRVLSCRCFKVNHGEPGLRLRHSHGARYLVPQLSYHQPKMEITIGILLWTPVSSRRTTVPVHHPLVEYPPAIAGMTDIKIY